MNYTYLQLQTAIGLLNGVGPARGRELLNRLPSIEDLFFDSLESLSRRTEYPKKLFEQLDRQSALDRSMDACAFHEKKGVKSIFYTDDQYPFRLSECSDAPLQLFIKGDIDLNGYRFVSVVGTRSATEYGREICDQLIRSFIGNNIVVVSGLAFGVDAWAHHYCVEYGVPTIGVLGHGLDRIYPAKHKRLAGNIIQKGALLTEFVPGTNPDRENFPKRNRIVAGMCDVTVVVESKESGGSLITAELANDYNRDVFAVPGNVFSDSSSGCNQLIRTNQAQLYTDPESFLKMMGWNSTIIKAPVQRKVFNHLSKLQQQIISVIQDAKEIQVDLLSVKAGLPISKLNVELFNLELEGVVRGMPGNKYRMI